MANYFERLETDTAAARQRFMNIPVIKDMLSEQSMPLQPDPEAKKFMLRLYQRFLEESYYHVRVARIYAVAGFRVKDTDTEIAKWFMQHGADEHGHHHWIENDLRKLGADPSTLPTGKPSVWCEALVGYLHYVATYGNPIGLFGDTYVIEGLSHELATRLAKTMKHGLKIPDEAVTYLAKHGEADQGHMDEFRDMLNANLKSEDDYQDIVQVSRTIFALYGGMIENLLD